MSSISMRVIAGTAVAGATSLNVLLRRTDRVVGGEVEILTTYGCNRQISAYGQIHWFAVPKTLKAAARGFTPRGREEDVGSSLPNKSSGIFIQYGAGGGGLTQAPSQ